jgi:hypothetical protein
MMALSKKDKEEIAAMFDAFAFRFGPAGQQSDPTDRFVYDTLHNQIIPVVGAGAEAFGQRFVESRALQSPRQRVFEAAVETALVPSKRKKAMTKFNRAVKEGMKIVKASKSYGKKGTISNGKKAFSAVTKAVSKARKGAKLPKKGVLRSVQSKAKGILGTIKTRAKKLGKPRPYGGRERGRLRF